MQLLDRLEKGEQCMSFKEFDLSDYISALEDFKSNRASEVIKHWGSIENFDMFIQKMKDDEDHVAKLAIQQFGSIEKYTEEMKKEDLFLKLASNREKAISSDEIQHIVQEIIAFAQENAPSELFGTPDSYCHIIIDTYSNDYLKTIFDTKHGKGSCDYIVKAFRYYLNHNNTQNN